MLQRIQFAANSPAVQQCCKPSFKGLSVDQKKYLEDTYKTAEDEFKLARDEYANKSENSLNVYAYGKALGAFRMADKIIDKLLKMDK